MNLQHERTSPDVLTAHGLRLYIAHRDSETNRYYFGEDELACLEETPGQLVGYVCTALFSKQEHETSPMFMTVLPEA